MAFDWLSSGRVEINILSELHSNRVYSAISLVCTRLDLGLSVLNALKYLFSQYSRTWPHRYRIDPSRPLLQRFHKPSCSQRNYITAFELCLPNLEIVEYSHDI